tara:strand:+ start:2034 stop:2207 length:174 start_codon:yes stop_codon:yes gene_type:complete
MAIGVVTSGDYLPMLGGLNLADFWDHKGCCGLGMVLSGGPKIFNVLIRLLNEGSSSC